MFYPSHKKKGMTVFERYFNEHMKYNPLTILWAIKTSYSIEIIKTLHPPCTVRVRVRKLRTADPLSP